MDYSKEKLKDFGKYLGDDELAAGIFNQALEQSRRIEATGTEWKMLTGKSVMEHVEEWIGPELAERIRAEIVDAGQVSDIEATRMVLEAACHGLESDELSAEQRQELQALVDRLEAIGAGAKSIRHKDLPQLTARCLVFDGFNANESGLHDIHQSIEDKARQKAIPESTFPKLQAINAKSLLPIFTEDSE